MKREKSNYLIFKEIVYSTLGNKCKECGEEENLNIHHIDEDYKNNNISNILLLCKRCHINIHSESTLKQLKKGEDTCKFCGKIVFSIYKNQIKSNLESHEKYCPLRPKEEVKFTRDIKTGRRIKK